MKINTVRLLLAFSLLVMAASSALSQTNTYAGGVSGTATQNTILKSSGPSTVASSNISDDGTTVTVATSKTLAVTTADKLTVGGVIVPQGFTVNFTSIAATNASGDFMFIAPRALQVTSISIVQRAQGGSGCVVDVEKITGTTAPGSGTVMGTASYNCNSTANNTVTTYTLTGTTGTLQLAAGDRMGIKLGGTLTSLAGATVTVHVKAI